VRVRVRVRDRVRDRVHLDQVLLLRVDIANTEGLVQVRVYTIEDRRDVDVHDVAVLQLAQWGRY
jgi:hypothetical protein